LSILSNKFLLWACVLLIWAGVIAGTLWSKGYQPQTSRRFTDEEMIRIAVARAIQRMQSDPPRFFQASSESDSGYELFEPAFVVPYRDVDHFLEKNPECCEVRGNLGYGVKTVWVHGDMLYKDRSGQVHSEKVSLGQRFPAGGIRYLP
jgi:hypothetical protein